MKKIYFLILALAIGTIATAQTTDSYCKGLKNPTSFVISSSGNSANASWYGFTGTKLGRASTCGNWGMGSLSSQIAASQLESQSGGSSCTSSSSVNIHNQSDYQNRFVIKGSGNDPLTSNHLSYLPPDSTYTSSIRLGNNCGGTQTEIICYQFEVRPQNALISFWYALSLQNGQHDAANNPEFAIEIEKRTGSTWTRIGGDTLCCIRTTPVGSGSDVSPFYVGSTGTHTGGGYASNIYLPWNKVVINLNNYLYETVRIKVGSGDCAYSAHYGYCYIAGECQPMELNTSDCIVSDNTIGKRLTAPSGLDNYVWYKCNSGAEGITDLTNVPSSINFTQITNSYNTNNVYDCQTNDFFLTEGSHSGQFTSSQVFRCDMTTRMNPNIPLTTKLYALVQNVNPVISIDTVKYCNSSVRLTDMSYMANNVDTCDTSLTRWYFYSGDNSSTPIVDSTVGGTAIHQWDNCGTYAVRVRSYKGSDTTHFSEHTYPIHVICNPSPAIGIIPGRSVCAGDSVTLVDNTQGSIRRDWIMNGDTLIGRYGENQRICNSFDNNINPVELKAYNEFYLQDTADSYDTLWCSASAYDTVEVFIHPELTVTGDYIVCDGQTANIHVECETPGCTYRWFTELGGTNQIASGQDLQIVPSADTSKYYLRLYSPNSCVAWDSVYAYRVRTRLSVSSNYISRGDSVTLTATGAYSYSWTASPADTTLTPLLDSLGYGPAEITVAPQRTTFYTLLGHGQNGCNTNTTTEQITVHESNPLAIIVPEEGTDFAAPHAFTPGLAENNTFHIYSAEEYDNFSVYIYNRMGYQVFHSNDLHFSWNGNVDNDGIQCTQGAYVWVIRYRDNKTHNIVTQKGTVTLIR